VGCSGNSTARADSSRLSRSIPAAIARMRFWICDGQVSTKCDPLSVGVENSAEMGWLPAETKLLSGYID